MRYSPTPPLAVSYPVPNTAGNRAFLAAVAAQTQPDERCCALLLVGGSGLPALALRRAQAGQRYDRLPSFWSHAALLLRWEGEAADAVGAEVSLWPQRPAQQVPVRNGVTLFSLGRYLDEAAYPNLAVVTFTFRVAGEDEEAPKRRIQQAALHPNQERMRYPLWDELAGWASHVFAAHAGPSPLLQGRALPAAAFCEYVYEAGGVDLAAGATSTATSPDTLWATVLHWHDRLDLGDIAVRAFAVVRDEGAASSGSGPADLEAELAGWPGSARGEG